MVGEEPTRKLLKRLRAAGFTPGNTVGSHTKWSHELGPTVSVPDGHRTISPGVVRQVNAAIAAAREAKGE
ncbi:type II toxin-antitoxin system HicA family toxin [Mycobacterium kansasii]